MSKQSFENKNTNDVKIIISSNDNCEVSKNEINSESSKGKNAKHQVEFTKEILDIIDKKLNELDDNNTDRFLKDESFSPGRRLITPVSTPIDSHEVNGGR